MTLRRRAGPGAFGLFVEGAHAVDLRGHDALQHLWEALARQLAPAIPRLFVHGFSKAQVVSLHEEPGVKQTREPLDILIERHHREDGFEVAIVAFDARPPNQHLKHHCPRTEVDFVLERFIARRYLPEPFLDEASNRASSSPPSCGWISFFATAIAAGRAAGETVEKAIAAALAQIRERDYAAELRERGAAPIHEMAAVFDGKRAYVRVA